MSRGQAFNISAIEAEDGTAVLRIEGELELATVDEFDSALAKLEALSPRTIVVDCFSQTFIDSTGLEAFVEVQRRAQAAGRELVLIPGPKPVQRVFELTGMDRFFTFKT